ncbi:MAG: septal ring lytic transglycosylase RlpA family lipoprotein, partial [Desulfamplus sp.]|nr:septal ring lytic transglycosylase RlpA family lipoprotein [Desulfamplus sp.]
MIFKRICTILSIAFILFIASCTSGPSSDPPASSSKVPATSRPYTVHGQYYRPLQSSKGFTQTGVASWYGKQFHGRKTA